MKTYLMLSVTILVALTQHAFASVNAGDEVLAAPNETSSEVSQVVPRSTLIRNGIYTAVGTEQDEHGRYQWFTPSYFVDHGKKVQNFSDYTLSENEAIEAKVLKEGNVLVTIRLGDQEEGQVPRRFVATPEEFAALNLRFDSDSKKLADYSNFDEATYARHGGGGRASSRHHRGVGLRCKPGRDVYYAPNGHKYCGCVAKVARELGFDGKANDGVGMVHALAKAGKVRIVSMSECRDNPQEGDRLSYSGYGSGDISTYHAGRGWCLDTNCHAFKMSGYRPHVCARGSSFL